MVKSGIRPLARLPERAEPCALAITGRVEAQSTADLRSCEDTHGVFGRKLSQRTEAPNVVNGGFSARLPHRSDRFVPARTGLAPGVERFCIRH
jgi:hypothetical protein